MVKSFINIRNLFIVIGLKQLKIKNNYRITSPETVRQDIHNESMQNWCSPCFALFSRKKS
jgi:hypothetical protein